jgi:hypothetical protein
MDRSGYSVSKAIQAPPVSSSATFSLDLEQNGLRIAFATTIST